MDRHKILNGGQKRTLLAGPKERKARKACQKAMMAFRSVVFALTSQTKAFKDKTQNKGKGKDRKGKGKEGAYPRSGLSASETPNEEGCGRAWPDESWASAAGWFCTKAHCMDGADLFEPCQPSNTRGSGPWLHTVD